MAPTTIQVGPSAMTTKRSRRRDKALLCALQYDHRKGVVDPIPTNIEDAELMQRFLLKRGFLAANIVMLTDKSSDPAMKPTREIMLREIRKLMDNMLPGDRRVFFYAGHGCQIVCEHGTETDDLDEVLLVDGDHGTPDDMGKPLNPSKVAKLNESHPHKKALRGIITDNELYEELVCRVPRGCRLTAIFDACHSGTILDLPYHWVWRNARFVTVPNKRKAKLARGRRQARTVTVARIAKDSKYGYSGDEVLIPRCASPDNYQLGYELGEVYSLSSAQDDQLSWGKGGATMTKALLNTYEAMGGGEAPIISGVMQSLNDKLEKARQDSFTRGLSEGRVAVPNQSYVPILRAQLKEMQLPQFGSLSAKACIKKLSF